MFGIVARFPNGSKRRARFSCLSEPLQAKAQTEHIPAVSRWSSINGIPVIHHDPRYGIYQYHTEKENDKSRWITLLHFRKTAATEFHKKKFPQKIEWQIIFTGFGLSVGYLRTEISNTRLGISRFTTCFLFVLHPASPSPCCSAALAFSCASQFWR